MTRTASILARVTMFGFAFCFPTLHCNENIDTVRSEREITFIADPEPKFPISLFDQGIATGRATLVVTVNDDGYLSDWLVIEATHRGFIEPIDKVIQQWTFEPATVYGVPVQALQKITIFFDVSHLKKDSRKRPASVANSQSYSAYNPQKRWNSKKNNKALKLATVSELDRYPEVVNQYQPMISSKSLQDSIGSNVTFKFYIDTNGRVRMSSLYKVKGEPAPEAILAAHDALANWQFKPIKSNGKPVILEVAQTFEFSSLFLTEN